MSDNRTRWQGEKIFSDHFGGCPQCGGTHGFRNIGREHWFFCCDHGTKWCVGSNLFSSWREQTEADWQHNAKMLHGYRTVEPALASKSVHH